MQNESNRFMVRFMAKPVLKAEAVRLRRGERLSLNEILHRLHGRVSKSTLSLWLRDHPLEVDERRAKVLAGVARSFSKGHPAARPVAKVGDVFSRRPGPRALSASAMGTAVEWFASRGYAVSLPLGQEAYDLVVESDVGLKRVQVKTTNKRERNGAWSVQMVRNGYDHAARVNAGGRRHRRPYSRSEMDIFFIVTGAKDVYVIPVEVVEGRVGLVLDNKYKNFMS